MKKQNASLSHPHPDQHRTPLGAQTEREASTHGDIPMPAQDERADRKPPEPSESTLWMLRDLHAKGRGIGVMAAGLAARAGYAQAVGKVWADRVRAERPKGTRST